MAKKKPIKKIERNGVLMIYLTATIILGALIYSTPEYWTIFFCIVGALTAVLAAVICPNFIKTYGWAIAFYTLVVSTIVILQQINSTKSSESLSIPSLFVGIPFTMAVICGGQLVMQVIATTVFGAIAKEKR